MAAPASRTIVCPNGEEHRIKTEKGTTEGDP